MASHVQSREPQSLLAKVRAYGCSFALLGMAFWFPDILAHAILRHRFDSIAVAAVTMLLPSAAVFTLVWLVRRATMAGSAFLHSVCGVAAIWFMGPLMMTCSATFTGGGFASGYGAVTAGLGTVLFPLFTLSMSVYEGSFLGVCLVTVSLPLVGWLLRRSDAPRA